MPIETEDEKTILEAFGRKDCEGLLLAAAEFRKAAQELYSLLDDIDTVFDRIKTIEDGSSRFRDAVGKLVAKRFAIGSTDGYSVVFLKGNKSVVEGRAAVRPFRPKVVTCDWLGEK